MVHKNSLPCYVWGEGNSIAISGQKPDCHALVPEENDCSVEGCGPIRTATNQGIESGESWHGDSQTEF
ncbi:MAG TPA: hypothetical protein DDY91_10860 [Planctomycetaceae bacterium]|nr:hypothetical protein [Planctomycetaceae bacterium]